MGNPIELCACCRRRPAARLLTQFPVCLECYNAITAPDDICFECGEPLAEGEEVFCSSCEAALWPGEEGEEDDLIED